MSLIDAFTDIAHTDIKIYPVSQSNSVTTGIVTTALGAVKANIKGFVYDSAYSERFLNQKFKAGVDAIAIIDYKKLVGVTLLDSDRFVIGSNTYQVVHYDNIGLQNEVMQILLKKVTE